jgi:hypothetical protein
MPVPGLSLVGFMDHQAALTHLGDFCLPADKSPLALEAEWNAAKLKLGSSFPNAGQPDVQELPSDAAAHINALMQQQWFQTYLSEPSLHIQGFKLVEIDPLLAFQHSINKVRSTVHGTQLSSMPTLQGMLDICLPIALPDEEYTLQQQANSLIIKARSLNLRIMRYGQFSKEFSGVFLGPGLPLAQVSYFNGRYYLTNGFHRALCLREAGVTHIPCLFRTPLDPAMAGIGNGTFGLPLLEGADPPTLGHFTQGRAYDVTMRLASRIITLTWSEWGVLDE